MNVDTSPLPLPQTKAPNLIAVASGKGGVGKTWFAVTLVHALALSGRRALLFDGDLGLANVDIQLGLTPQHDLGQVIAGRMTLNQVVTRFEEGGFSIIAGRSGSGGLATLASGRLAQLGHDIAEFARDYDEVVLDLGAGLDRTVRILASQAGICLVVVTGDPTSLTDAYAFIKVTSMADRSADLRVVVNLAESHREGEQVYQKLLKACQGFLKISPPLAGVIRRDKKVAESIRNQTPLLTRYPNCEAAQDVMELAARLRQRPR